MNLIRERMFAMNLRMPETTINQSTSKNSDLLAASTSQKTTWLKYIPFKSDTSGTNFPIKSNL